MATIYYTDSPKNATASRNLAISIFASMDRALAPIPAGPTGDEQTLAIITDELTGTVCIRTQDDPADDEAILAKMYGIRRDGDILHIDIDEMRPVAPAPRVIPITPRNHAPQLLQHYDDDQRTTLSITVPGAHSTDAAQRVGHIAFEGAWFATDDDSDTATEFHNPVIEVTRPSRKVARRRLTDSEKLTMRREFSRVDSIFEQEFPEHRALMNRISTVEPVEGLDAMNDMTHLERQIVEDCHLSGSGDVLRNTGIDHDSRPKHLRPMGIMRLWKVDGPTAERIAAALRTLSADPKTADVLRKDHESDKTALDRLFALADEMTTIDKVDDDNALSGAARYYDDTTSDKLADDDEPEVVEGVADYDGADRGYIQFVNMDDVRDGDYRDRDLEPVLSHPACPWSLRQSKMVQDLGRALNTADTPNALKTACNRLVEAKPDLTNVQASVLWGLYFRTRDRITIRRFGAPSTRAIRYQSRLREKGISLAKAAVAIHALPRIDQQFLSPYLFSARRRAQAAQSVA